jgi:ADP-ribosylglycohydrolase
MLVELAIGDAYGAGFEYASPHFVERYNTLAGYVAHPRHNLQPGAYTDDTQMSLALAEAITSGEPWTPAHLAQHFVTAFKRDPREGYAQGFYNFLVAVRDGQDFLQRIRPHSDKSGAAMRAAPAGVFSTPAEVIEKSRIQAALTHNTPPGIDAAVVTALAAHYFIYNLGPKEELGKFLEAHVSGPWSKPWQGKVGEKGWMSVRAALTALHQSDSMAALLKACIAFTGDVDTVAAIALAIGSCTTEIAQDLPGHLYKGLEDGPFGYRYLAHLDTQLLALVTP